MKRLTGAAAVLVLLAGCAQFSPDGGLARVGELTKERVGQTPQRPGPQNEAAKARIAELLAQPLTADSAVAVAYLVNRDLQQRFAELGIAEADLVQAGRPANPSIAYTRIGGGGITEIDRGVTFDVLSLLTLPLTSEFGRRRFEQAQLDAAAAAVALASDVRRSYYAAVAAQQQETYAGQVKDAAEASHDVAERLAAAGNISALARMREQAFYAEATSGLAQAHHATLEGRERLVRLLGGRTDIQLPERLPDLPARPIEPKDAEQTAIDRRLDVLRARAAVDATARALGLTKATRFVNVLEAGYQNKSQTGDALEEGYALRLELPLFDFGAVGVARAEATYMASLHRAAQTAIDAQSDVRIAYSAYRTRYDVARRYRDEIVPLRKRISDENLRRYNGMLIDVFGLLADARDQVASVGGAVDALRDFWIAQTDLDAALTGAGPATNLPASTRAAANH